MAILALATVCFLWGTTYLAIRISVETIPPLYLISARYIVSGAVLLMGARLAGAEIPRSREMVQTAICGVLCIGFGNGLLVVAETWMPSGLAALFYTTAPFWMVGIEAVLPGGMKPRLFTLGGLTVGFFGVVFLIWPAVSRESIHGGTFTGFLLLQFSVCSWTLGALLQKRVQSKTQPFVSGAIQQLAAGLAALLPALAFERIPKHVSVRSELAFVYLITFGSLIGFSCFVYAVAKLPVSLVSVYTFVNPVVAVLLGWMVLQESFGNREVIAMVIIFTGVALVRQSENRRPREGRVKSASLEELETLGPEP